MGGFGWGGEGRNRLGSYFSMKKNTSRAFYGPFDCRSPANVGRWSESRLGRRGKGCPLWEISPAEYEMNGSASIGRRNCCVRYRTNSTAGMSSLISYPPSQRAVAFFFVIVRLYGEVRAVQFQHRMKRVRTEKDVSQSRLVQSLVLH